MEKPLTQVQVGDRVFVVGELTWGTVTEADANVDPFSVVVRVDVDDAELAVPYGMMYETEEAGRAAHKARMAIVDAHIRGER